MAAAWCRMTSRWQSSLIGRVSWGGLWLSNRVMAAPWQVEIQSWKKITWGLFPTFLWQLWQINQLKGLLWSLLCNVLQLSRNTNQSVERKACGPSADLAEQSMGMNVDSSLIILGSNSFCVQIRDAASENIWSCFIHLLFAGSCLCFLEKKTYLEAAQIKWHFCGRACRQSRNSNEIVDNLIYRSETVFKC